MIGHGHGDERQVRTMICYRSQKLHDKDIKGIGENGWQYKDHTSMCQEPANAGMGASCIATRAWQKAWLRAAGADWPPVQKLECAPLQERWQTEVAV